MPNVNRPNGLSPVKYKGGAPYTGAANLYCILAASTSAFAIGDVVATGGSADGNGVPSIVLATAGGSNAVRGVIVGIGTKEGLLANPGNLDSTVRPAAAQSTNWYALVVDDPDVIFEAQEIGGGTPFTAAEVGLNASLSAGSGNNGYSSSWQIDSATEAVTATLQCKLLGLVRRPDNAFGDYARWLILLNNHELGGSTGTVGL